MTIPVKPINEIEEKSEVSINDKILILDSVSEEARLASKDELKGDKWDTGETWPQWPQGIQWPKWDTGDKWDKGDKWDTWATGATWPTWATWPQWAKWDAFTYDDFTPEQLEALTWPQWETWPQWPTWATGNWISSVTTSKSWKTTTVTMNYTSWEPTVFQVQDWADWQGSGDMNMSTYDPTGKMADAFDYDNMYNTPENLSDFNNDVGYITTAPVQSVNWQTGEVSLTIPSTAADVWALPDTSKYWANLSLTINSSTYVVTAQLKDQNWNDLWTAQTIDLPLESVVVSGSYDSVTKKVVLTLQSGSTIEFSVADLISWLQSEITSTNKLDSDLVDDTNQTHKFVTQADKDSWDGKQDELESWVNIRTINWTSILWSWNIDTPTGIPSQTWEAGKFLTTDGTTASWANVDALPSQTGQSWKFLTTNWTTASWDNVPWLQVAPNSPIKPKYTWYGTEAQYAALTQYYTEVEGDTEFHCF